MKIEENEEILWNSENSQLIITTNRIRKRTKTDIKSFLLTELDSCEIKKIKEISYLRDAIFYLIGFNIGFYLLNNHFLNGELMRKFFGDIQLSGDTALIVFVVSLILALLNSWIYIKSIKSVLTFTSKRSTINLNIKHLDFDEITQLIDIVESAKIDLETAT